MLNTKKIKKKDINIIFGLWNAYNKTNKENLKMSEQVINIRDRIEKMRSQMTPQSSEKQEKSFQNSSKTVSYTHLTLPTRLMV